jgi:hypothetical protein
MCVHEPGSLCARHARTGVRPGLHATSLLLQYYHLFDPPLLYALQHAYVLAADRNLLRLPLDILRPC